MSTCKIAEALKYIEDVHKKVSKNNPKDTAMLDLFNKLNQDRAKIQQEAAFLGFDSNINKDTSPPWDTTATTAAATATIEPPKSNTEIVTPKTSLREQYRKFADKLITFVTEKKKINIVMSKNKAVRYIKDVANKEIPPFEKESLAWHKPIDYNTSEITYPDYDALLKDKGALKNIQNALKLKTIDDVIAIVKQEQQNFHLEMAKVHEHIHAGAVTFMATHKDDAKTKYVNKLFEKTLKEAESNEELGSILDGYWKKNVDEFLAVALSNPDMVAYLNGKKATGFVSVLHKLVDTIAKMVGIKAGSESQALFNIFAQMAESTLESEEEDTSPPWDTEDTPKLSTSNTGEQAEAFNKVIECS